MRRRSSQAYFDPVDGVSAAVRAAPPLMTVHQLASEMASSAAELAPAYGRGERVPQPGPEVATKLAARRSTTPPAS
ncbi:hypothetical protein ACFWPU_11240 [Streptomyces sp. NPDC058471]|uniref:hypothetical protein n=1 Tax=Streptomyces sp. NPDC058471 TaxID=3346516 RepID=UPI00365017ED